MGLLGRAGKAIGDRISAGTRLATRGLAGLAKGAAVGAVLAGAAVVGLSAKMLALATDAGETQSKFETVFGKLTPLVTKFNNHVSDQFGVTTKSLQDATALFGVFGQGANLAGKELVDFSTGLVMAALDLSSFYNVSVDDAFGAIQSGLSGEAEPLRAFSIFLSEANLNAFAASVGIKKLTSKMTEQEKVALRGRFILANLGKAQGDLSRTSGGLANQQRALQGRLEETGTILGKALLPAATDVVSALNGKLAPAMTRLRDIAPDLQTKFSGFVDKAMSAGSALGLAFKLDGVDGVVKMVDSLTGSGGKLYDRFDDLKRVVTEVAFPKLEATARALGIALGVVADHTKVAYIALTIFLARAKIMAAITVLSYALAIAQGVYAAATGAAALATEAGTVATKRQVIAQNAQKVALAIGTAATTAYTFAMGAANLVTSLAIVAWNGLTLAIAANPFIAIALLIAAVAVGLVVLYRRSETARGIMNAFFTGVKRGVGDMAGTFIRYVRLLLTVWLGVVDGIVSGAAAALGWIPGLGPKLKAANTAFDNMKDGILTSLDTAATAAYGFGEKTASNLAAGVKAGPTIVFDVRAPGARGAAARTALDRKLQSPTARAMGGPVRAFQPYLVGERGPELIAPQRDGHVMTARETAALMATRPLPARDEPLDLPRPSRSVTLAAGAIVINESGDPRKTLKAVRQALQDAEADA